VQLNNGDVEDRPLVTLLNSWSLPVDVLEKQQAYNKNPYDFNQDFIKCLKRSTGCAFLPQRCKDPADPDTCGTPVQRFVNPAGNVSMAISKPSCPADRTAHISTEGFIPDEPAYEGPLCASCASGYAGDDDCTRCGVGDGELPVLLVFFGVIFCGIVGVYIYFRFCAKGRACSGLGIVLMLGVFERTWPRLRQGFNIFVSNYQIVSRMPAALGILFPVPFNYLVKVVSAPVNFDVVDFPGMGCVLGRTFYHKFWMKLIVYILPVIVLDLITRVKVWQLRKAFPIENNTPGSWKKKVRRTILMADIKSSTAGWRFAFIYLLYPSTTNTIFQMFYCRDLLKDAADVNIISVLEADYQIDCTSTEYQLYFWFAVLMVVLIPLGVPGYFWYNLYVHKVSIHGRPETMSDPDPANRIPGNPKYIVVAPLRPLFRFYKPECHYFEVYFLTEKLILTGLVGLLKDAGGFFLQNFVCAATTTFYMCLIARYMPSRCPPYNKANLLSHAILLLTFMMTTLSKVHDDESSSWISQELIGAFLVVIQGPFWTYLVWVSWKNLMKMYDEANEDIAQKDNQKRALMKMQGDEHEYAVGAMGLAGNFDLAKLKAEVDTDDNLHDDNPVFEKD
jgi:hypothetical protein